MKTIIYICFIILISFLINNTLAQQDISVQELIGKSQTDVINKYGKPVHIDNSSPSMICLFYKTPNMVFVADELGVYQAEITKVYPTQKEAREELDRMIKNSLTSGYTCDTLSISNIQIKKIGILTDINLEQEKNQVGYALKVKSIRHEE